MALTVPANRGIYIHTKNILTRWQSPNRIVLTKATHAAIDNIHQLADSVITCPTRISEIVPLFPSVVGTHNDAGVGTGGVSFAAPHISPRNMKCKILLTYLQPLTPTPTTTLLLATHTVVSS